MQQDCKGKHTLHHTSAAPLSLPSQTLFFVVSENLDVIGICLASLYIQSMRKLCHLMSSTPTWYENHTIVPMQCYMQVVHF